MKNNLSVILSIIFISLIGNPKAASQNNNVAYSLELSSTISSQNTLPFWLTANKFGSVPNSDYILANTSIFSDFKKSKSTLDFSYKASFTGYSAKINNHILINELYGSVRYKNLQLDLGVKHQDILWEGLSSSNGNIAMSTNARSLPGYNLALQKYIKLPFAKKWLSFKGNYADYVFNDKRIVNKARLHTKSLYFKSKLSSKIELITGLNHYVQWGGTSSLTGKQPASFKDYLRIVTGSSGGSDALETDQLNVLGNHIGSYLLQFNYKSKKLNWNFYYSHPFEDTSGRELQNWKDGIYGLFFDFKKPKALITTLLTEFTYTKNMSGNSKHGIDAFGNPMMARGRDDYFNNGVYNSGWTYFGNTIGSPYLTTKPVDEQGITQGVISGDNRLMAFNIGFKGFIYNLQYKVLLSHTSYFGWFDNEYSSKPQQFSGLLEVNLPQTIHVPFKITIGTAFDTGTYRPVNFGGFLKLTKQGFF